MAVGKDEKFLLVQIRLNLFQAYVWKNLSQQTKSAVIPEYKFFFILRLNKQPSRNARRISRWVQRPSALSTPRFFFSGLKLESSISRKIRNFLRVGFFIFRAWKVTSWKYRSHMRLESSISGNIRKFFRMGFFNKKFWGLRSESAIGSYFCKMFHSVFWICLRFWIYQDSKYASSSKYVRVPNIPFLKYKKVPFLEN